MPSVSLLDFYFSLNNNASVEFDGAFILETVLTSSELDDCNSVLDALAIQIETPDRDFLDSISILETPQSASSHC